MLGPAYSRDDMYKHQVRTRLNAIGARITSGTVDLQKTESIINGLAWDPKSHSSAIDQNCKWHIGCGLDGGGVWSLGHVGVSLVYTLRTLKVRADLPSSVKPLGIFGIDFEC
ncbi:hypothetical protein OUZ56_003287 [Daphnia magna]|uniref:Uncharacterized protein n=1 Tax=Daphnia magna TaxID=35525 RepID=A0ABR0A8P8_9CRUS|nr:hypothetical protein OUZ56_003287 [Daphnia magna]